MNKQQMIDEAIEELCGKYPEFEQGDRGDGEPLLLINTHYNNEYPEEKIGDYTYGWIGYSSEYYTKICTRKEFEDRVKEIKEKIFLAIGGKWPDILCSRMCFVTGVFVSLARDYVMCTKTKVKLTKSEFDVMFGKKSNDEWLPPVGEMVEVAWGDNWVECIVTSDVILRKMFGEWREIVNDGLKFRPIQSERDKVIDAALEHFNGMIVNSDSSKPRAIASKLYDAGMLILPK